MGNRWGGGHPMTGACWWLAERASLLLAPDERAAVWGDLVESGEPGRRVLAGMGGLVVRRCWRPWLALLLATGIGLVLVRRSFWLIHMSATDLWMYAANWRAADLANAGFWRLLAHESGDLLLRSLLLIAGSLAAGVLLGIAGRKTPAVIFSVALALANPANVPREGFLTPAPLWTIYPFLVLAAVIIAPAILTMRWWGRLPTCGPIGNRSSRAAAQPGSRRSSETPHS